MVSNVITDEESFTMATAEEIVKLDDTGNIIWSQPLSKDEVSSSYIWEENDTVYMINSGFSRSGYFKIPAGKSFIPAYDKKPAMRSIKRL
jgi:hypothetical protein